MDRRWVLVNGRVILLLPESTYTIVGGQAHPWDLDCMIEQLRAAELGFA